MTDRERMIEVINGWLDTDEQSSYDLSDRLIEAGFGRVEKKPHDKYKGKPEHDQAGWQPK